MTSFHLHITSGHVVVIDPMFIDCAQHPLGDHAQSIRDNSLFLNSDGFDKLRALEAIAMGRTELDDDLRIVGYYDLTPIEGGTYSFSVSDIRRVKRNTSVAPVKHFSVDSAQILVFDAVYLEGVLEHFSWKRAYTWFRNVNRRRERKYGRHIAGRDDVYVQVQSPGVNRGVAFTGDGEYYFRDGAFKLVKE